MFRGLLQNLSQSITQSDLHRPKCDEPDTARIEIGFFSGTDLVEWITLVSFLPRFPVTPVILAETGDCESIRARLFRCTGGSRFRSPFGYSEGALRQPVRATDPTRQGMKKSTYQRSGEFVSALKAGSGNRAQKCRREDRLGIRLSPNRRNRFGGIERPLERAPLRRAVERPSDARQQLQCRRKTVQGRLKKQYRP